MRATPDHGEPRAVLWAFRAPDAACVRTVVAWTVAGGISAGGMLVGVLTVTGRVSPGFQLLAAPVLFLVGTFLGCLHGAVLALVGRPVGMSRGAAVRKVLLALLLSLPAVASAWVLTTGISLTAALVTEWRGSWAVMAAVSWTLGGALCVWAGVEGWRSAHRALTRWPYSRTAWIVLALFFAAVSISLSQRPPTVAGARLNVLGALLVAAGATLWIALPLLALVGRLIPRESSSVGQESPGPLVQSPWEDP